MRRIAFAIFAIVILITSIPAGVTASNHTLAVGSQHTTDTDFSAAAELTNLTVSGTGEASTVKLESGSFSTVDSFEDGDITEYTGETGPFSTTSSVSTDGSYALTEGTAGYDEIFSSSGLPDYPEQGDVIKVDVRMDDSSDSVMEFRFGGPDSDNTYNVDLQNTGGVVALERKVGGSETNLDTANPSFSANEWYTIVIDWQDDGKISVDIVDENGDLLTSLEGQDTTYTGGGIGFASGSAKYYWDNVRITAERATPATYISQNHTVSEAEQAAINITEASNVSVDIYAEYHDGSTWQSGASTTVSTVANHTISLPSVSSSDWRLRAEISKTGTDPAFKLADESILFHARTPAIDNTSATPDSTATNNENVELSINVSDADFGLAQSDNLTAEFFVDGSSIGTNSTVSNGTISHTATGLTDGSHTWNVVVTDDYGETTTSDTFSFTVNHYPPAPDNGNVSPADGGKISTSSVTMEVPLNDTDFAEPSGDEVQAEFFYDGSKFATKNITSNGTVSASKTVSIGGQHTWHVEFVDEYGNTNQTDADAITSGYQAFTFSTPSELSIYNESAPDTLINSVDVELRFYGQSDTDPTIVDRTTSDGTVDMTGLPVDEEFVVVAEATDYYNRRIYLKSLFKQQQIFLLPKNKTAVYNVFNLDDKSGNYPPSESRLIIQRALNRSGNISWYTISGDFFGATNVHKTYLRYNERHRLIVENNQGDRRVVGGYMALDEANPKVITISSIIVDPPSGQQYRAEAWLGEDPTPDNNQTDRVIRFKYLDEAANTTSLSLTIHERGNVSNVLESVSTTTVGTEWTYSRTISGTNATDVSWVANWSAERTQSDGTTNTIGQVLPIGNRGGLPIPMDQDWLVRFAFVGLPIVAALSSERLATLGAIGTVAFAGVLMILGIWPLPVELWIAAGVIAVGGHAFTTASRGSVYG